MARYAARRIRRALDRGTPILRGYEGGFLLTREGRNLWFQERLANRLYGRHPFRWLRVLFELRTIERLAASGREAYGRLARRTAHLVGAFALSVVRDGLPPASPVTPR
jgi:hypothetical protein